MFTLQEAQAAIANKPEFKCNEREFGFNIDYVVTMPATFVGATERETLILKNLRGTCFDKTGKIISLGFDKFHNLNECPGWLDSDINWNEPHYVMLKLDGSMIRPLVVDGKLRLITRAGITDVAVKAEKYINQLPEIQRKNFQVMCMSLIDQGYTPIFEFCSRDQRIVIDYPDAMMPLTAMRCNVSGKYATRTLLEITGADYSWCVVDEIDSTEFTCVKTLANLVSEWKDAEGVVIAFPSGFRVKIKASEYVMKHKTLDGLRFEKDVVALILTNTLDDVLSFVAKDQQDRLKAFQTSVITHINKAEQNIQSTFEKLEKQSSSRAEFASFVKAEPVYFATFLFSLVNQKPMSLREAILKNCSSSTKLETMRWAIGPCFNQFK